MDPSSSSLEQENTDELEKRKLEILIEREDSEKGRIAARELKKKQSGTSISPRSRPTLAKSEDNITNNHNHNNNDIYNTRRLYIQESETDVSSSSFSPSEKDSSTDKDSSVSSSSSRYFSSTTTTSTTERDSTTTDKESSRTERDSTTTTERDSASVYLSPSITEKDSCSTAEKDFSSTTTTATTTTDKDSASATEGESSSTTTITDSPIPSLSPSKLAGIDYSYSPNSSISSPAALLSRLSTTSTSSSPSASSSMAIPRKIELTSYEKKKLKQNFSHKFESSSHSLLSPSFLEIINNPEVKNVLITGCGGGFDFTHGMLIYPELKKLKKNIIIGSYSFGSTENIKDADVVWQHKIAHGGGTCQAKKVNASSQGHHRYCPEYRMALYLDECFPQESPHFVYAYNARLFSVPMLTDLYSYFIEIHAIDTIIIIDGGTDSLMKGDEYGLGDPVEDCVSMTTAAILMNEGKIKHSLLLSVGFGMDRFNNVSDSESLRAVAELTHMGGFLGSISIEKTSFGFQFYKNCIEYINNGQSFRSVMSHGIISATEGNFGFQVPPEIEKRVRDEKGVYLWPLISMIWAFNPQIMMERSLLSSWIKDCETAFECSLRVDEERAKLRIKGELREICNIPTHNEILDRRFSSQSTPISPLQSKEKIPQPLFIPSSLINGRIIFPLFFLGGYLYDLFYRDR